VKSDVIHNALALENATFHRTVNGD